MRKALAILPLTLALLAVPGSLLAKGRTIRITIQGGDLAAPVEITDPQAMARFNVWTGPGTFVVMGGSRIPGSSQEFPADWSAGVAEPPEGCQTYDVSIVTTRTDRNTYMVRYAIDPSTNQGFVYIPGKGDAAYPDNVWMIYRGVEGNWFRAWSEWEKLARPLIARARKTR